jgi:hypothetical protein
VKKPAAAKKRRGGEEDGAARKKPKTRAPAPSPAPRPRPRYSHRDDSTLRMSSGADDDEFSDADLGADAFSPPFTPEEDDDRDDAWESKKAVAFPLAKVNSLPPHVPSPSTAARSKPVPKAKAKARAVHPPGSGPAMPGASLIPVKYGKDKEDIDAVCAAMHALKQNRAREVELKIARVVKDLQAETRAQAQLLADEIKAERAGHEASAVKFAEKSAAKYAAVLADAEAAHARIKADTKRRIRAFEEAKEEDTRWMAELAAAVARSEEEMGRKAGAVKDSVARKSARAAAKVSELQKDRDSGLGLRDMLMTLVQQLGPSE